MVKELVRTPAPHFTTPEFSRLKLPGNANPEVAMLTVLAIRFLPLTGEIPTKLLVSGLSQVFGK